MDRIESPEERNKAMDSLRAEYPDAFGLQKMP